MRAKGVRMHRPVATRRRWLRLLIVVLFSFGLVLPVAALSLLPLLGLGIKSVRIVGNTATAEVGLLGIVGTDLILEFEDVQGLTAQNLGLSAKLINPLSPTFRARLPEGSGLLTVPLALQLSVEPPASGGLQFRNTVRAELHTHMLGFTLDSQLRLYKSPRGGRFFDITRAIEPGSVRASGRTGGFSDFIIVLDLLPSQEHAEDKFAYLDARLDAPAISPPVRALLESDLASARGAFEAEDYALAKARVDTFVARVRTYSGAGIPNLWRAARDRDNIAGDLIGNAESLKFSIDRASREW
jgi:hypothetical protein